MLKITAIGNLTNDVELRSHKDGKAIKIGDTTYVFAVGKDSKFKDYDNAIDLTDYKEIKEPLKKAHIKRHEGKGRRNRPEFSQFLRPNAGFCPVF